MGWEGDIIAAKREGFNVSLSCGAPWRTLVGHPGNNDKRTGENFDLIGT